VEALKFLRPGRVAPITGVQWPEPGEWLESDGPVELCRNGVHALPYDSASLAVWVAEELWRVELEDVEEVSPGLVAGRRARLVERIEAWNDDTAREFARACAGHVQDGREGRAAEYAADAKASAEDAVADFTTTTVAYMARHAAEATTPGGFEAEKEWQSRWLAERLGLPVSV
jgi:hypothetical protein